MDCSCDFSVDGYGERLSLTFPKAIKKHICGECDDLINPGDKYEKYVGTWDGEFFQAKTCMACVEVRDQYLTGYGFTEVWEEIKECYGDISLSDFETFSTEAQIKIIDML
jgi:hypothetical protein